MDIDMLLGLELSEADQILKDNNIKFTVNEIKGYKDQDILNIPRVIKIKKLENDEVQLTVTYFSTSIE
ncbi:hypothetical protein [Alkalithermobacter paradoxus]|uniref:PASTA domain-containing protein n=1 Tax=Alkalithermobacter paradoxus TaxID=29349 RepID=A0A1V4IB30_9FIRM|nr:hypothetical protein CLOTH_04060 [[Clostridium] thermoalcaliphilum]